MIKIDIYNHTSKKVLRKPFLALADKANKILAKNKVIAKDSLFAIEVTFVGDEIMRLLNKKYRGKDRPTDVISLSYLTGKMKDTFVGEIFINIPFALKQAQKFGHALGDEFNFLFVHGLLHIFGYDHKTKSEKVEMDNLTRVILGHRPTFTN